MNAFISHTEAEQLYRRGFIRRNHFRKFIHTAIIATSFILSGCQKNAVEFSQAKITNTETQECIELSCAEREGMVAMAEVESDGNLSWANITLSKPCDAQIVASHSIVSDTITITLHSKGGTTENCFCTNRYRYECTADNNSTIIKVMIKDAGKKVVLEKSFSTMD